MSRALWFVAGAASGVYALAKARRTAEAFTPDGIRDRWSGLSLGAHLFGQEVRAAMASKENELRRQVSGPELSGGTGGLRQLPAEKSGEM